MLSHRGLNLVTGPRHMAIKPNYDSLLIQGYTQVWRPRHVTHVTFEVALSAPIRSFAILHDARTSAGGEGEAIEAGGAVAGRGGAALAPSAPHRSGASHGHDGSAAPAVPSLAIGRSKSLKFLGPMTLDAGDSNQTLGGENSWRTGGAASSPGLRPSLAGAGTGVYGLRRAHAGGGVGYDTHSRTSNRNCAAVTFVPASHFSPLELEEALGPEVAPGPRAQAAALRAGSSAVPGPLPVELLLVVDCCGPTGMAYHLMQLLQTLALMLRSLPVADSSAVAGAGIGVGTASTSVIASGGAEAGLSDTRGSAGGGMAATGASVLGSSSAAASALASAALFNIVIVPGGPPPPEEDDEEEAGSRSRGGNSNDSDDDDLGLLPRSRRRRSSTSSRRRSSGVSSDGGAVGLPQPKDALPPMWFFPSGARPVTAETVAAAIAWVGSLVTDANNLVLWAQPMPRTHLLLSGLAAAYPRVPGYRRAAVLLCQHLKPHERAVRRYSYGGNGSNYTTPRQGRSVAGSRAVSRAVSRAASKRGGMLSRSTSKKNLSRALSRMGTLRERAVAAAAAAVVEEGEEGAGADGALGEPGVEEGDRTASALEAAVAALASRSGGRAVVTSVSGADPGLAGAGAPAAHVAFGEPPPPLAHLRQAEDRGEEAGDMPGPVRSESPAPQPSRQRPRSSIARSGQPRSGLVTGSGTDGVRFGPFGDGSAPPMLERSRSRPRAATDLGISDSDPDSRVMRGSGFRSADGAAAYAALREEDKAEAARNPDPPRLGFPVFVVVHELAMPPLSGPAGGGGGGLYGASGPSYLMAYHVYQKHLEGLLYEQAREDVQQLSLGYFRGMAEAEGGFLQVGAGVQCTAGCG